MFVREMTCPSFWTRISGIFSNFAGVRTDHAQRYDHMTRARSEVGRPVLKRSHTLSSRDEVEKVPSKNDIERRLGLVRRRTKTQTTRDEAHKELVSARNSANRLRKTLFREAANEKRRQFFERIDNDDIHQIKRGVPVTYNPSLPAHALRARFNIASIFGAVTQPDRRLEALQNLIELCHVREPHHMNPASRASKDATAQIDDATPALEEGQKQDGIQGLQDVFASMELIPLVLPSFICLFCLGDTRLSFVARTTSFSRIDSLRRHMNELHLSHYDHGVRMVCPHPSCDTSLENVNHFKNHAATVHNVFLSK